MSKSAVRRKNYRVPWTPRDLYSLRQTLCVIVFTELRRLIAPYRLVSWWRVIRALLLTEEQHPSRLPVAILYPSEIPLFISLLQSGIS